MKNVALIITAVALTLVGCAKKAEVAPATTAPEATAAAPATEAATAAEATAAAAPAGAKVLKVTLSPMGGSNLSGTATFTEAEAGRRVEVVVTGAAATSTQVDEELREGTCAKPGGFGPGGAASSNGPFTGKFEGPSFAGVDDLTAKPLVVVIRRVADSKIVSCGEIRK